MDAKWVKKYHALDKMNDGNTNGFLDIGAGINLADKVSSEAQNPPHRILIKIFRPVLMCGFYVCKLALTLFWESLRARLRAWSSKDPA